MWKMYEYCVKTTTISHRISHVWCVNLSDRACETLCEKDNIFHTLFHIVFTCPSHGKISHACGISCETSVKNMWIPCENNHFFTHYFTWFFTCLLLVVILVHKNKTKKGTEWHPKIMTPYHLPFCMSLPVSLCKHGRPKLNASWSLKDYFSIIETE